jgi:hypothetical protein
MRETTVYGQREDPTRSLGHRGLFRRLIGLDDSYAIPFIVNAELRVEGEENAYSNWPTVCGLGSQSNPRRGHRRCSTIPRMETREGG